MLSNKLTFSLASLVVLLVFAFGTMPVMAHKATAANTGDGSAPAHSHSTATVADSTDHTHPTITIEIYDADASTDGIQTHDVVRGTNFIVQITSTAPTDAPENVTITAGDASNRGVAAAFGSAPTFTGVDGDGDSSTTDDISVTDFRATYAWSGTATDYAGVTQAVIMVPIHAIESTADPAFDSHGGQRLEMAKRFPFDVAASAPTPPAKVAVAAKEGATVTAPAFTVTFEEANEDFGTNAFNSMYLTVMGGHVTPTSTAAPNPSTPDSGDMMNKVWTVNITRSGGAQAVTLTLSSDMFAATKDKRLTATIEGRVDPEYVEITSTATGHGGNAFTVTFKVTDGIDAGSMITALGSDPNMYFGVTNGYFIPGSLADTTGTATAYKMYVADVQPQPRGTTEAVMVNVKTDAGLMLKPKADGSAGNSLTMPHTAPGPTVTPPTVNTTIIPAGDFLVVERQSPTNGIQGDVLVTSLMGDFRDLAEFFRVGGTLEVLLPKPATGTAPMLHDLVITEIMWGLDGRSSAGQWMEFYNDTSNNIKISDVRWSFSPDRDVVRDEAEVDHDSNATTPTKTYVVVDRVSTLHLAKWNLPGQSGNTNPSQNPSTGITPAPTNLISAYRKRDLNDARTGYKSDKTFGAGIYADSWAASARRINIQGYRIATPGHVHLPATVTAATAVSSSAAANISVVFNEVRNAEDNNYDFIELYNHGSGDMNLKDWEISIVKPDKTDVDLIDLFTKDYTLKSKELLLILPTNPRGNRIDFNEGVNQDLDAKDRVERGAQHKFIVRDFTLPNTGTFMLVLRDKHDKNAKDEHIKDLAGYISVADPDFNTEVWPLKGWKQPGDRDNFGEVSFKGDKTWNRKDYGSKAWFHKDAWEEVGNVGGLGYRRNAPAGNAIGTPGYARDSRKDKLADYNKADSAGEITISEIMYDDGTRGNTAQWIELYNSSFTNTVNLNGWSLEVVNHRAADGYVDAKIEFKEALTILPNQTVLIVSGNGVNNVAEEFVYSLFQHHRRDLSLTTRKSTLLSSDGFRITLSDKDDTVVDTAGNLKSGRSLEREWELPTIEGRQSLVRIYGVQEPDNDKTSELAEPGTMASSWWVSNVGGLSYYGHRDDMSTPGYRDGGPLPVSLSSFRPARDKATGEVVIRWITQSELNNAGFNILRSETKTGEFKVVNVKGIIPGHGTTSEKHVYTWTDTSAKPNVVYYYQIEDVSLDGNRTTLRTTHLRGNVNAAGKLTTYWGELKTYGK